MIGAVHFECLIHSAYSLKDKRSVLLRLKNKIRKHCNVSIAEMDYHDTWNLTALSAVTVANSKKAAEKELAHVLEWADREMEIERTITTYEWL
ncbi:MULTISPECIES: DUF503 domain-containing protein [Sinobaca]|uniref:DUF503 domain-containing protein n=1 Tax=Sinobaca qinghaiensis TaxID=342944 RepID=A0A419V5S2_9BACL|nr:MULTISPECIES: DUF503 domain-containing protein [Sinobaca]RKD75335.1 hypothetical protein ATL39_1034 [Sinobaca qinghaiensis]